MRPGSRESHGAIPLKIQLISSSNTWEGLARMHGLKGHGQQCCTPWACTLTCMSSVFNASPSPIMLLHMCVRLPVLQHHPDKYFSLHTLNRCREILVLKASRSHRVNTELVPQPCDWDILFQTSVHIISFKASALVPPPSKKAAGPLCARCASCSLPCYGPSS